MIKEIIEKEEFDEISKFICSEFNIENYEKRKIYNFFGDIFNLKQDNDFYYFYGEYIRIKNKLNEEDKKFITIEFTLEDNKNKEYMITLIIDKKRNINKINIYDVDDFNYTLEFIKDHIKREYIIKDNEYIIKRNNLNKNELYIDDTNLIESLIKIIMFKKDLCNKLEILDQIIKNMIKKN